MAKILQKIRKSKFVNFTNACKSAGNAVRNAYRTGRSRVIEKVRKISAEADHHPRRAALIFAARKQQALYLGVHPAIIKRADAIHETTGSVNEALGFLGNYIRLAQERTVGGYYDDFISRLQTEEEIDYTRSLLEFRLGSAQPGTTAYINLRIQLFRLKNAPPDAPEVLEFIRENMERSLKKRLATFKSRKMYFNRKDALETMMKAKKIFDEHGKRFFLLSGTLLGAIREGDFISNDYDIDLGVLDREVTLEEIKRMFEKTDFKLIEDFDYKVGYKSKKGIIIEFFMTMQQGDAQVERGWKDVHHWYFSDFDLMEYEFLGQKFWIPDNYEKHLEENFGNWRKRTIFYDVSYDVPSRVYGHNTEALLYLTDRMSRAISNGWRYWSQEPAKYLRDYFDIDYTDLFPRKVGEPTLPPNHLRRTLRPIVVLGDFMKLEPHMVRILESAKSLNDRIVAGVFGDAFVKGIDSSRAGFEEQRLALAKVLEPADDAYLENRLQEGDASRILAHDPSCVVVEKKYAPLVQQALMHVTTEAPRREEAGHSGDGEGSLAKEDEVRIPRIVTFDEAAMCLTLDDEENIIVRDRARAEDEAEENEEGERVATH